MPGNPTYAELKQTVRELESFIELIPDLVCIAGTDGYFRRLNPAWEESLGYTMEELTARPCLEFVHPEDRQQTRILLGNQLAGKKVLNFENRYIRKDGSIIHLEWNTAPASSDTIYCVARDITDRKRAEKALEKSQSLHQEAQERYEALFERSFDGVYLHDLEGRYIDANTAVLELTGYTKAEVAELKFSDLISPDQMEEAAASISAITRDGSEERLRSYQIRTKTGELRDIEARGTLIYRDEQPYAILGVARDVTKRKRIEARMRLQAMIADRITDYIVITDMSGRILYVNEAALNSLKREKDALEGQSIHAFGEDPDSGSTQDEILQSTLENGRWEGTVVNFDSEGNRHRLACRTFVVRDDRDGPAAICGIATNITEKEALEERLRQTHKLEAVGTLAGGIAHDFNNILGIILGNAELAKLRMEEKSALERNVDQIVETCLRGKGIIRQLLDFSRQGERQKKFSLSLVPVIKESLKLLRTLIPANIDIRQHYTDDAFKTSADPSQINQVIINLCTNAYQAISRKGGAIEVIHDTVMLDQEAVDRHDVPAPGRYIRLRVRDTGDGIPPEHLNRIFDPYYTTKKGETGTGLGLSVVHGIVRECGGAIAVDSRPGEKTTFTILLPVTEEAAPGSEGGEHLEIRTGRGRVLFVDDEQYLTVIAGEMLEKLGYEAHCADTAGGALEMISADPDRFDLVITDMAMPRMTGPELAREIFRMRPGMPMILCTGHHDQVDADIAAEIGFKAFLMKPLKMAVLADTVRRVIDGGGGEEVGRKSRR